MGTCVNSPWQRTRSNPFAANTVEPETGHIAQFSAHCEFSLSRQVQKNNDAAPEMRCAILDVVSWFPGCPGAALDRRQRAMPASRTLQRKKRYGMAVGLRDLWMTGRRGHQVAARFGNYGSGKWAVQPACCRSVENPAGTSAADCTSRHTHLRALGSGVAERPAAEPPLLLAGKA